MLTIIEKVMFLQNVDVFGEVLTEQLAYVAAIAEEVSVSAGGTIYREQEAANAMYVVVDGRLQLRRKGMDVAVVGPKEAVGTWALFDDEPRVVTALALEDTRLLRVDKDDFIDLLSDHVEITQGVLTTLAKRLRGLVGRVGVEPIARSTP